ncbi:MAG: hypothetical protein JNL21_16465 [Myxococcales bacterium]|nr:hypothetical protein [Myxococcales bacterium]
MRNIRSLVPAAALALSLFGASCKDEKPVAEQPASAAPSALSSSPKPEAPATKKALVDVTMPDEVVAIAGVDSPVAVLDSLTKAIAAVQPGGEPLGKEAASALAERYDVSEQTFDLGKPLSLAVFDPKKHATDPLVLVVRVGSKDKLLEGAKGDKKPDAGGGLVGWGSNFARVDGEVAMISKDKELLEKNEPFLRELAGASAGGAATFVVPMQHVGALYGKDLDALAAQAEAFGPAEQAASTKQMFSFAQSALKELDNVTFALKPTDDGLSLDIGAKPTALSTWRAGLALLSAKETSKLAAKLPKESLVFATAIVPAEARPLAKKYFEWASSLPGGGGLEGAMAIWEQSWDAMTGEFAMAVFQLDDKPVAFALSGVTDAEKVRSAQRAAAEKVIGGPQSEQLKKLGMKMTYKKAAYKVGDVEVDIMKTELAQGAPPGAAAVMSWFGETHSAVSGTEALVAYGPSAKTVLEAYLSGKLAGGLDASPVMDRAKKSSLKDALLVSAVAPTDLAAALGLPVEKRALPPLTISVGSSDGALHLLVDLPAAQLPAIAVGAGALQSAAMAGGGLTPPPAPAGGGGKTGKAR